MINEEIFNRIEILFKQNRVEIAKYDILAALIEELGEFARAVRIEDLDKNKTLKESSKVEIIDLILVCIEAYISRGGTYNDMLEISKRKLLKWEQLCYEKFIS